jgi:Ca2+-binding EF-hand superfamily protein
MKTFPRRLLVTALLLVATTCVVAQDKMEYDRRNVTRYLDLFQMLDRDNDGAVSWSETQGDVNFMPRFDDIDIDRDGRVTMNELYRYLGQTHGMSAAEQRTPVSDTKRADEAK